uniref:hypothetical protein n=1 Tax=Parabacteroides goldsteinii TaxID=328812 RepID=UPI002570A3BC
HIDWKMALLYPWATPRASITSLGLSVLHIGSFLLSSIHNVKEKIKYAIPDIYFYYACHLSLVQ